MAAEIVKHSSSSIRIDRPLERVNIDWSYFCSVKRDLPRLYLANEEHLWNDDDFIPRGASKENRDMFRKVYRLYFRQICESDGFDIDIYPGDARAAVYIPYLDFQKEADLLMELAHHAIQDYNDTSVYKYQVLYVEKVNFIVTLSREFFMTIRVKNLTLLTPEETFQIRAYKGPHQQNVVRLCRKKILK